MKVPDGFIYLFIFLALIGFLIFLGSHPKEITQENTTIGTTTTTIYQCPVFDPVPCNTENKANYTALKSMLDLERSKNNELQNEIQRQKDKIFKLKNRTFNALTFANNTKDYLHNTSKYWNTTNKYIINQVNTSNNRLLEELLTLYRG